LLQDKIGTPIKSNNNKKAKMKMIPSDYPRDHTAIVMAATGKTVTYGELEDLSNQIAHLFRSLGAKRGDVIALCMENHWLFLPVCWAAFRSGLYFTAISYRLQASEVEYIVNDCGAKVLITSKMLEANFRALKPKLENAPVCFMVDGESDGASSFESAISNQLTCPIDDESYGERLLYSSGTTGNPKGIKKPLPEYELGAEIETVIAANRYEYNSDTIYLSPAPLYHAAPLGFNMTLTRFGATTVIMEHFDAQESLRLIEAHYITHSQWVPTMFVRMLKLPDDVRQQYDMSSLKFAVHAAAPCPVDVKEQMIQWWGPVIWEYYAGTESTGRTIIDSVEWLAHKGSVGRAVDCSIHIVDDNDDPLPTGEIGGVYFESKLTFEYLNDPVKTAEATSKQGWTTLGDVGYLDDEGYLYLTDRKSFMIISGGVNIYPQETENALISHPKVMDVAVFGVPDADFGEAVKAVVQPMNMEEIGAELEAELIAYCRSKISHIKCPKSVDFLEELPRHPTGKLYKRLLKDQYWQTSAQKVF
jgi:long-chain acyl-CoA synthetase